MVTVNYLEAQEHNTSLAALYYTVMETLPTVETKLLLTSPNYRKFHQESLH